ncbi:DinB family protein [Chitinophaga skermanii]|uniref:DinB family protein n=1 Tax=Chitinophaga skermanii TaxID=331697 RepID=A0A327QF29_9BACT|nr:DinB family protein [Chitinophaga skermanii]RAJ00277.1 DinB family protein [Chitinophaga skermanii]
MSRPLATDYAPYADAYVSKVPGEELLPAFKSLTEEYIAFLASIPAEKIGYAYGTGKWTIVQVLQHVIDTERIFCYRALRFARMDTTPLAGFEEDDYANAARVVVADWPSLVEEFKSVRHASIAFFARLNEEELERRGVASNHPVSVKALGYLILGHAIHHQKVIEQRYF